jgi:hypothetical protein
MVRFENGPAAGAVLELRRAPLYLRVTTTPDGTVDALDQLSDVPRPEETLMAYRRTGGLTTGFLDYTDAQGRRRGRPFVSATYAVVPEQPGQDVMRDRELWCAWATAEHARQQAAKESIPVKEE